MCDNNSVIGSSSTSYFVFNGEISQTRLGLTAGIVPKISNTFLMLIGAGYGERELLWGVIGYSNQNNSITNTGWAKNIEASFSGPEIELGFQYNYWR
jgi:hypothetical protein